MPWLNCNYTCASTGSQDDNRKPTRVPTFVLHLASGTVVNQIGGCSTRHSYCREVGRAFETLTSRVISCRMSGNDEGIVVTLSSTPESQWIVVELIHIWTDIPLGPRPPATTPTDSDFGIRTYFISNNPVLQSTLTKWAGLA